MSQPRFTIAIASASVLTSPNSSMSAPAMKPFALPDAMTSPFGGSRSRRSSASFNSASTAADSVLVVVPALSNVSRAKPSAIAGMSFQCSIMSRSISIAPPSPPPMQIAAMPRRPPVRSSTFSTWRTMRAPDAPTGWPSAIAPPSTLSLDSSICPSGASETELRLGSSRRSPRRARTRSPARRTLR